MTKVGILLPTREAVFYGDRRGDPRPLVELAVRAEELGFDSVWAGDSLLARPRAEPLTLLAGVATQTNTLSIGTAVLLPSMRNAELLAQSTATLDALSGGRFILGIGGGPGTPGVRVDHELVGADFVRRASTSVAVAERVKSLWRGTGDHQMYPLTHTEDGPPIWMGGDGPRTLDRTGRLFDGWFPLSTSPEAFSYGLRKVRESATNAGRQPKDIDAAAYLTIVIGDPEEAQPQLAEHAELYYGVPFSQISQMQGSFAGHKDAVVDWLRGFVDAGVEHLCIRFGCNDPAGQLELLAELRSEIS